MNTPADSSPSLEAGASAGAAPPAHDGAQPLAAPTPRHDDQLGGIIGAGLFVGSSVAIAATGPMVIVTYALTGLMVLIVMRCLGEMAVSRPDVRSFTEFARAGLRQLGRLHRRLAVLVFLDHRDPCGGHRRGRDPAAMVSGNPQIVIGTVLMAAMTAVNLMSTRSYAEFEFWFASIKVAAILVFIAVCAAFLFGSFGPHQGTLQMWDGPRRTLPQGSLRHRHGGHDGLLLDDGLRDRDHRSRRITGSRPRSCADGVVGRRADPPLLPGSIGLIVCIVPWDKVPPGVSPFVIALDSIRVPYAAPIMTGIILTAVLSCLNSSFYVVSRVLFVLAASGDAPRALVRLNSRRVPARSVLLGSVAGFVGILAHDLAPSAVFAFLVNASGALIVVIYGVTCAAQIRLRSARERAGLGPPELRVWLFPWASYAAIAAMVLVLIAMALDKDMAGEFWASAISIAVAFAAYLFFGAASVCDASVPM